MQQLQQKKANETLKASETLAKMFEKYLKTIANICNIQMKHLQHIRMKHLKNI
jgi:hypothetical protein